MATTLDHIASNAVKVPADAVVFDPVSPGELTAIGGGATYNQWGAPFIALGATKDEMGWVHLTGTLRIPLAVTEYVGDQLGTLPVGMRPAVNKTLTTHGSTGTGGDLMPVLITVATNGVVSVFGHQFFMATTVEKYLTLDGLKFPASDAMAAWPSGIGLGGGIFRKSNSAQNLDIVASNALLTHFNFDTIFYSQNGCTVYRLPNGQVFMDGTLNAPAGGWTSTTDLMTLPPEFRHPDPLRWLYLPVAFLDAGNWGQCILGIGGSGSVRVIYGQPVSGTASTVFYVQGLTWKADRPAGVLPFDQQPSNEALDQSMFPADAVAWVAGTPGGGWVPYGSTSYYDPQLRTDEENFLGLRGLVKNGAQNTNDLQFLPAFSGERILAVPSSTGGQPGSWRRFDIVPGAGVSTGQISSSTTNGTDTTSGWHSFDGIYLPRLA